MPGFPATVLGAVVILVAIIDLPPYHYGFVFHVADTQGDNADKVTETAVVLIGKATFLDFFKMRPTFKLRFRRYLRTAKQRPAESFSALIKM